MTLAAIDHNWNFSRFLSRYDYGWQALNYALGHAGRSYAGEPPCHTGKRLPDIRVAVYCGQLKCGGSDRTSILLAANLPFSVVGLCNAQPALVYEPFRTYLLLHGVPYCEKEIPACDVLVASGPAPSNTALPKGLRAVVFFLNAMTEAAAKDYESWRALNLPKLGCVSAAFSLNTEALVVWNGADELASNGERHGIVYLGRYAWEKNLYALIAAASRTPAQIDMFGEGSEEQALRLALTYWVAPNVNIYPPADTSTILSRYDALILSSVLEASPSVVAEAMLSGAIVIATPVGDVPAIIGDGRGVLSSSCRPEHILDAIETYRAMKHTDKEIMRLKAKRFAQKHLTVRAMCSGFADAIVNVAS